MNTQASISSIESRAIQGSVKKAGSSQPSAAGEAGRRAEAVLHDRLADHPAHRHRRQHERQQEDDPEELSRPDLGVEEQRQAEGDRVFEEYRDHVVDHVAERVPVERVAPQRTDVVEAVEPPADGGAEVPVRERDVEPEDRREDHHGDGEEHRRQDERGALPALAADEDLAEA